jgi:hypothetical protein
MLAPTAPGIAMASCRQLSTPGTSLLSPDAFPPVPIPGRWRVATASFPRPAEVFHGVAVAETVWQCWNGVAVLERCGSAGTVWQCWNGVAMLELCSGTGSCRRADAACAGDAACVFQCRYRVRIALRAVTVGHPLAEPYRQVAPHVRSVAPESPVRSDLVRPAGAVCPMWSLQRIGPGCIERRRRTISASCRFTTSVQDIRA